MPIALSSMLQQLFNSADTAVVGKFADKNALAAVGTNGEIVAIIGPCLLRIVWIQTIFRHFHTLPTLYIIFPITLVVTTAMMWIVVANKTRTIKTNKA